jgi:membrane protease YdiL (CAAX protease family)
MAEESKWDQRTVIVTLAIAVEGGLILVAWLAGWLMQQLPLATFIWNLRDALLGLAATLPMLALFFACLWWPIGPIRPIQKFCDEVLRPMLAPCTLLDLAGISILAGFGEEMLFRGVFQAAFAYWIGNPWIALLLASVLFGLCHAITAAYLVLATLMGVYLGWLWQESDNLQLVIVTHAVYDFIALLVLVRLRRATSVSRDAEPREGEAPAEPH